MMLEVAHVQNESRKGANGRGIPGKRGIVDGSREIGPGFQLPPAPRGRTRGKAQKPGLGRY